MHSFVVQFKKKKKPTIPTLLKNSNNSSKKKVKVYVTYEAKKASRLKQRQRN